jgi:hypothetical protein
MSVKETIIANLASALEGITIENGYLHTNTLVQRTPIGTDDLIGNEWFAIEISDTDKETPGAQIGDLQQMTMNLNVNVYIKSTGEMPSEANLIQADVQKCIHALDPQVHANKITYWDSSIWGYLKYVGLGTLTPFGTSDAESIFIQEVEIIYYYPKANP